MKNIKLGMLNNYNLYIMFMNIHAVKQRSTECKDWIQTIHVLLSGAVYLFSNIFDQVHLKYINTESSIF